MKKLKVLFQSRKTSFTSPGGDTVQMMKTKEYLEKMGVEVDISLELEPPLYKYDVVHIFNLIRPQETYLQALNAKRRGKKVVLSPIYCDFKEYEMRGRRGIYGFIGRLLGYKITENLKVLARAVLGGELHKGSLYVLLKGFYRCMEKILEMSDLLLPNSESEMIRIENDFQIKRLKYRVIPNGVDDNIYNYDEVNVMEKHKIYIDSCICVGRIEGRKNQLNLVRAFKNLPYTLLLVGRPSTHHVNYYKKVLKEAPSNVKFLGFVPDRELPSLYKVAKVHVLPSWMETTGLTSLEAGAMRCNIVVTDKGDTRDYFGDLAFYCEPDDVSSIERAVRAAYNAPFREALRELILKNYTWKKAAEETLKAYEMIL